MKKGIIKIVFALALFVTLGTSVFAGQEKDGGYWSYGGYHDPSNWGAFSNYYHPDRRHYSKVLRDSDAHFDKEYANAEATSEAFINTHVGEYVVFDCGF